MSDRNYDLADLIVSLQKDLDRPMMEGQDRIEFYRLLDCGSETLTITDEGISFTVRLGSCYDYSYFDGPGEVYG